MGSDQNTRPVRAAVFDSKGLTSWDRSAGVVATRRAAILRRKKKGATSTSDSLRKTGGMPRAGNRARQVPCPVSESAPGLGNGGGSWRGFQTKPRRRPLRPLDALTLGPVENAEPEAGAGPCVASTP